MMQQEILTDIQKYYNLDIEKITPLSGGWLNEKYMIKCIQGNYVVKIFSTQRYSKEGLKKIEEAAKIQMQLQFNINSAKIIKTPMRHLENNLHYHIMTYVEGKQKDTKTITKEELLSLGKNTAKLHQALMKIPSHSNIDGTTFLNNLWKYHFSLKDIINQDLYDKQTTILHSLEPNFFDTKIQGWCHEDLAYDNIIFQNGEVSAILDFDRCKQSYYLHDIGRIILSFCFTENKLIKEHVDSFIAGYNMLLPLSMIDIIAALKITWCIETQWWINKNYLNTTAEKPTIFKNELLWLTDNFFKLQILLKQKED